MAKKRAFISFDFDNDADLRNNLVAQSKRPGVTVLGGKLLAESAL